MLCVINITDIKKDNRFLKLKVVEKAVGMFRVNQARKMQSCIVDAYV